MNKKKKKKQLLKIGSAATATFVDAFVMGLVDSTTSVVVAEVLCFFFSGRCPVY